MSERTARRAFIYARISIDRDMESEAPDRQLEFCRSHCKTMGWEVAGEFVDRDRSAFTKGTARPQYEEMLRRVRDGEADAVVAFKIDRVGRRVAELARLVDEFQELRVALVCPGDGIDTSTSVGALVATIIGAIGQMESEANSQRRLAKNKADAISGKYIKGGHRAFGRNMNGTLVEDEADAIRTVAERVIAGETLGSLARWLNDRGLRTTTNSAWLGTSLGRMLREPHLRGIRVHNGEEHRGAFEPILDEATGLRLIERLRSNPVPRKGRSHLLSGLATCGRCGGRMNLGQVAHPNDPTKPTFVRYQCRRTDSEHNCGKVSASENSLDEVVRDRFFAQTRLLLLAGKLDPETDHADALAIDRQAALDRAQAAVQAQSDLADARFKERTVSAADYARLWLELQEQREAAEADLARQDAAHQAPKRDLNLLVGGDFERMWDEMSVLERRELLRGFINRVLVSPAKHRGGNRFDPGRVEIVWRPEAVVPGWVADEDDAVSLGYQRRHTTTARHES
jgi:DNA invertase Pin-like site-specific DNA recombinase